MTPAFQVLLCLCMLGLSSAVPKSRNIRWCVTSDPEVKKCNDLVNSCNVDGILLICVKKSSTEDCLKAISDGEADAISLNSRSIYKASLNHFALKPIMTESFHPLKGIQSPCQRERQALLGGGRPLLGAFVPECDKKGNYNAMQCHGSTGYCWCVNEEGKEINGTKTPPGQPAPTCEETEKADTPCLKEQQKLLGEEKIPTVGRFVPQCDEKGHYSPQQCHGSTGHCWCVNVNGEEMAGTKTPPGQPAQNCAAHAVDTPCLKERRKLVQGERPLAGRFVPQCDERGRYRPQQCHGSTGYCWCVYANGEEIADTKTPPGQPAKNCASHDPVTFHYAVAVVKKSSAFQMDQLKGKKSCHSAVGETAGWIAPMHALLKKKLLSWEGPEHKSFEKVVSEFFSASCAPGAKEENLCKQCAGQGDKCKRGPGEPYYGDNGAIRCLKEGSGEIAFVEHFTLSALNPDDFELLCPDNTRRPLSQYKDCNFGKVPTRAVVTRKTGDKTKDITEYLFEAVKKQCKLFSSDHGYDLMFEDITTSLIPLPPAMDTRLFLGPEMYNAMETLHGGPLPSRKEIRWCTQSKDEKKKCDNWSAVSGGALKCTEPVSAEQCVEKVVKGEAEAVTISVDHMYTALKCGLVPAVDEYYNKDDFAPCQVIGTKYTDFGHISAVALVKKSDKDITWNNLKGKKSCHTGVGHQAGWVIPTGLISKKTMNCDIGSYFSESCAPGSPINSNLCKLCIGDPENKNADTKCFPNDKEAYYGNDGAIRCLVEKADVAFVPHMAVFQNTDGKNPAPWAKDLKSADFELLCRDGSRAPVTDYRKCQLTGIAPRTVITRPESLSKVVRTTINQQSLFGRIGFEKDMFQMFSSSIGPNLLFSDGTQCLIEFDRMIEKPIMHDLFGEPYHTAVYKDIQCLPLSALASACTFHDN
ncbi:saxiphilin-like [Dendropsophus ebraccatus]|uniref:saxiphilin-like n=1 Tax=Dendropsophus ebraccatus TaxID=150705 RepID=UPI0038320FAB